MGWKKITSDDNLDAQEETKNARNYKYENKYKKTVYRLFFYNSLKM